MNSFDSIYVGRYLNGMLQKWKLQMHLVFRNYFEIFIFWLDSANFYAMPKN